MKRRFLNQAPTLQNSRRSNRIYFPIRKLFCPDIQRIKRICPVSALFEQVLFRLFQLLTAFIQSNRLDTYLRNNDWTGLAKRYNGPAYAENQYDKKLEKAYHKHKK